MAFENASQEAGIAMSASPPPRENLIRATTGITLERATGSTMPTLTGYAAVFDQPTEINSAYEGRFIEQIARGAFTQTIRGRMDKIKVLFQHGRDNQIGDKPLGPIRELEEDDYGLRYAVDMLDTAYNRELIPGLEADLYGASFRFSVVREDFVSKPKRTDDNPLGLPMRTVQELRLVELGPVTWGAYPAASATVRSMTDEYLLATLARDHELPKRTGISLAGIRNPLEQRLDISDITCLTSMVSMGAGYIAYQDEATDAADIAAMTSVLHTLTKLIDGEIDEPAPPETDSPMQMGMYSAPPEGANRDTQTDPPEETPAPPETEPPAATTHSRRDLFWLAAPPKHLTEE